MFANLGTSTTKNPTFDFQQAGIYSVWLGVTDAAGCFDSTKVLIQVNDIFVFWIPSAFTPNKDEKNELFLGKGLNVDPNTFSMRIYDRWGEQIFYTKDLYEGWNGRVNNTSDNLVPEAVYVYKITFKDISGTNHQYVGIVSVIH